MVFDLEIFSGCHRIYRSERFFGIISVKWFFKKFQGRIFRKVYILNPTPVWIFCGIAQYWTACWYFLSLYNGTYIILLTKYLCCQMWMSYSESYQTTANLNNYKHDILRDKSTLWPLLDQFFVNWENFFHSAVQGAGRKKMINVAIPRFQQCLRFMLDLSLTD